MSLELRNGFKKHRQAIVERSLTPLTALALTSDPVGFISGDTAANNVMNRSMAAGVDNTANHSSLAVGLDNSASEKSAAIGWSNDAYGRSLSAGHYNSADGSILLGNYNDGYNGIGLGLGNSVADGVAIGRYNSMEESSALVLIGENNVAVEGGSGAIVMGRNLIAEANSIAVGQWNLPMSSVGKVFVIGCVSGVIIEENEDEP